MPDQAGSRSVFWYTGYALFFGLVIAFAALFYFGGYSHFLSNESSSFAVQLCLTQSRAHRNASVVVLGNSTAAEDFHANFFNARSPEAQALNLGVAGGQMYLFERVLEASMREGVRPRKLILIVTPEIFSRRQDFDYLLNDLATLKTILNAGDVARLAAHSPDLGSYANYASRVIARPVLFRAELRDFVEHPGKRLQEAAVVRGWLAGFGPATPMVESDNSFAVCTVGQPRNLQQAIERMKREGRGSELASYERVLAAYAPRAHQPLKVDAFETSRFRRMLQHFAALRVPVYVANAPYYDPDHDQYPDSYRQAVRDTLRQVVRDVAGVTLLPDFPAGCESFFDTVHLNRQGGEHFTEYLRTRVL